MRGLTRPNEHEREIGPGGFAGRRRALRVDRAELVECHAPGGEHELAVAQARADGVDAGSWLTDNRSNVTDILHRHGALLLRGFACDADRLQPAVEQFAGELFDYSYRSTPRRTVSGRVYTSTEYPSDQGIPLHNEMSYARRWPLRLWFLCVEPARRGGATPVADSRVVLAALPTELRERFERLGVQYLRRFGPSLDLPWQEAFQTTDRAEVGRRCVGEGISYEWLDDAHLATTAIRPAVATHPVTGERVWFNQAHLFHPAALGPEARRSLTALVGEDRLPRDARYGDGTPIADDDVAAIGAAYEDAALDVAWQGGDLLVVENMLVAHGRRSYEGARRVLVAMSDGHD